LRYFRGFGDGLLLGTFLTLLIHEVLEAQLLLGLGLLRTCHKK
jgi:hypothetical protein